MLVMELMQGQKFCFKEQGFIYIVCLTVDVPSLVLPA